MIGSTEVLIGLIVGFRDEQGYDPVMPQPLEFSKDQERGCPLKLPGRTAEF